MFRRKFNLVVNLAKYSDNRDINLLDILEMKSLALEIYKDKNNFKVSA